MVRTPEQTVSLDLEGTVLLTCRQIDRQTDRQTVRQTDRQTNRQKQKIDKTDRQTVSYDWEGMTGR